jgi:hypothetical protein
LRHQDKKPVSPVQQQGGPVSAPNKLPLPLPLVVRDSTSRFYKKSDVTEQINKADTAVDSQKEIKQNMQQNVADVDGAKVMRRDILANDKNSFKADINQEGGGVNSELRKTKHKYIPSNSVSNDKLYDDDKNESHERQKRNVVMEGVNEKNTFMVASVMNKEKHEQDLSNVILEDETENCEAGEKADKNSEVETLNMALLSKDKYNVEDYHLGHMKDQESPSLSDKHSASPQISDLGSVLYPERKPGSPVEITESASKDPAEHLPVSKANASSTNKNISGNQKLEGTSSDIKTQKNSEDKVKNTQEDVSTLSSIIKTPSYLSDPKLNDVGMKLLNEAVIKAKDISVVVKPMTRDLKSISAVQQMHDDNEHKEKKDT